MSKYVSQHRCIPPKEKGLAEKNDSNILENCPAYSPKQWPFFKQKQSPVDNDKQFRIDLSGCQDIFGLFGFEQNGK